MKTRRRRDPSRFFARGSVEILVEDRATRQVQILVTAPACVVQAATPQLLSAGLIDELRVAEPLAVWVPTVADEGFLPSSDRELPARVNAAARASASAALRLIKEVSGKMRFPGDLVPILPMGTYVTLKLRCRADDLAASLQAMVPVAGVAELRFSMASVLAVVLSRWGDDVPSLPPA